MHASSGQQAPRGQAASRSIKESAGRLRPMGPPILATGSIHENSSVRPSPARRQPWCAARWCAARTRWCVTISIQARSAVNGVGAQHCRHDRLRRLAANLADGVHFAYTASHATWAYAANSRYMHMSIFMQPVAVPMRAAMRVTGSFRAHSSVRPSPARRQSWCAARWCAARTRWCAAISMQARSASNRVREGHRGHDRLRRPAANLADGVHFAYTASHATWTCAARSSYIHVRIFMQPAAVPMSGSYKSHQCGQRYGHPRPVSCMSTVAHGRFPG
ncbi:hypothetical protein Dimus_032948 [Dionaea muscipula]